MNNAFETNPALSLLIKTEVHGLASVLKYVKEAKSVEVNISMGGERIVIPVENKVYAIDYFLKISQARQELLKAKHNLLNALFPEHFPQFLEAVGKGPEPKDFSYTVRDRVFFEPNDEPIDRTIIETDFNEVKSKLNSFGIPIYIDTGSTNNFRLGHLASSSETSMYYLDSLDIVDLPTRWNINVESLREYAKEKMNDTSIIDKLLEQLDTAHSSFDESDEEKYMVDFLS